MSDITETAAGGATETPPQLPSAAGEAAAEQVAIPARAAMIRTDRRISLALLLLCAGIYVPVMGSYGMFDPWETHYTEVARQFMVRDNWLETYWHNGRGPEGYSETTFWSKPVGSFWLSGLSLKLFGYDGSTPGEVLATTQVEWAVRLPFFLCGLFGIWCVYLMVSRLFSRRAGILTGVVLATAPMYFQITRQAMTDIPYVGLMSGGLALFALAMFGEREQLPLRKRKLFKWTFDLPHAASYYLFLVAFSAILALMLYAIMRPLMHDPLPLKIGGRPMAKAIFMGIYMVGWAVFVWMSRKTRTKNEIYLYWFYAAVAYAGLSKGLVGALQPGMVILLYLLASREWRMLADAVLVRGLLVALCVFLPWYHGMLLRFGGIGGSFWNEFFGTEQFRRLTIGEQAQARGTFQYYINQIAYGLYPWVAFLPAAVVRALGLGPARGSGQERARLFVLVWMAGALVLFTMAITKYHHYILPAIPPAAILVGVYLDDLLEGKTRGVWFSLLAALGVLAIVTFDLVKQPALWVWMYTYLYDSNWARGVPGGMPILFFGIAIGATMVLLFIPRVRKWSLAAMMVIGLVGGGYIQNWYQLKVAPNWSQKDCIATYYKMRKGPEEELVAWQFNWRGETWYTAADVVVAKSLDNAAIQKYLRERVGRKFFFITERSRWGSLRQMLPTERGRQTVRIVDDTNIHYVLASAEL
jgi:4-amino-4-deoxy-L-arabinose transferase-like glycosyltransferase